MTRSANVYIHPDALVETDAIGPGSRVWAHAHIMSGVTIGPDCNICDSVFIESGVTLGRGVTVKPHVAMGEGLTVEDGVFIGPHVVFTNDLRPRSPRLPLTHKRYASKTQWLLPTRVRHGATLGAGVVVSCGITIGEWSFAAAGAVLLQDVAPFALMLGNPARPVGYACACGATLNMNEGKAACLDCTRTYTLTDRRLTPDHPITLWEETP